MDELVVYGGPANIFVWFLFVVFIDAEFLNNNYYRYISILGLFSGMGEVCGKICCISLVF